MHAGAPHGMMGFRKIAALLAKFDIHRKFAEKSLKCTEKASNFADKSLKCTEKSTNFTEKFAEKESKQRAAGAPEEVELFRDDGEAAGLRQVQGVARHQIPGV